MILLQKTINYLSRVILGCSRRNRRQTELHRGELSPNSSKPNTGMELNATLGTYMPSFFSIQLNFAHRIENILEIPEHLMPTFYHEYFHFIQDVTTPFGAHFAWGNMSGVKRSIGYLQKAGKGQRLPIPKDIRTNITNELNLFHALNGDSAITLTGVADQNKLQLTSFTLELRREVEPFEEKPQTRFIKLSLKDDNHNIHYYWFGANAIIEGMAELIEEKHFGETKSPRFPYHIVQEFINFVRPEVNNRKDVMFVLCDLALQTNHPAYYLNDLLVNSSLRNNMPDDASQVYNIGFAFFQERGYDIIGTHRNYKNQLQINLNDLFGHQAFQNEREWINLVFENGFELRNQVQLFMLDLYNAHDPFEGPLSEVIKRLGTPDIVNINYERFFALPDQLSGREEQIHPILMTALFQFYKDLLLAQPRCNMIEICRTSGNMPVNQKCYDHQWNKINEEQICPLMAFYHAFGLNEILNTRH